MPSLPNVATLAIRRAALAWAIATCGIVAPTIANAGDSLLVLRSDSNDWLGLGQSLDFGPEDGLFTTSQNGSWGFSARFEGSGQSWTLGGTRERRRPLVPGVYGPARPSSFTGDTLPSFSLSGNGRACNDRLAFFDVRQIAYAANGTARQLWVVFEQHCEGAEPATRGEIRIDADTTIVVTAPLRVRARRMEPLALEVQGAHADGHPVTLAADPLPEGAIFVDHGNGSGTLDWSPSAAQQGHFPIAFMAMDGSGNVGVAHTLVQVDGDTLLVATSDAGDRAWAGTTCRLTPGTARVVTSASAQLQANVSFGPFDPSVVARNFTIRPTRPGNYSILRRWSDEAYAGGSFNAWNSPGSCNGVETHYRVRKADLGPGERLTSLWVEWEQHCDGEAPAFHGEMRINSGSPVVAYAPIARRARTGDTLHFDVSGRDTMGLPVVLSALAMPADSRFISTGPATSAWSWCPPDDASGSYTLRFAATNSVGQSDTVTTHVVVLADVSAHFTSETGDPAGGGASVDWDGAAGMLLTTEGPQYGTGDVVQLHETGTTWRLTLNGDGPPGAPVGLGRYSLNWPRSSTSGPGLDARKQPGTTHSWTTSDFRVRQLERSPSGHPRRLWLEFEQCVEDRMPVLRGELRLDARWRVMARAPLRRRGTAAQPMEFEVRGETSDGEIPSLTALELPTGASVTQTAPGRAEFQWTPHPEHSGMPHEAAFVATRTDGTADTAWTTLEVTPVGALHLEENGHTWHLTSNSGQFRVHGEMQWVRVTYSSPAADTLWSVNFDAGFGDTLQAGDYVLDRAIYGGGSRFCAFVPPNQTACFSDTGRYQITRLVRDPEGAPSTLWGNFLFGPRGATDPRSGWIHVGSLEGLEAERRVMPAGFTCSAFHPNPASIGHRLELHLPVPGRVIMEVYDVGGRHVRTQEWRHLQSGFHSLQPRGEVLRPGVYLVRVRYRDAMVLRRLVVLS